MRKMVLLGAVVALLLLVGPALVAYSQEATSAAPTAAGKMGTGRMAPITVDLAKYPDLAKAVDAFKKAATDLQAQAVKDLGDADGKQYTRQIMREVSQPLMPPGMMGGGKGKGKGRGGAGGPPAGGPPAGGPPADGPPAGGGGE